MPEDSTVTPGQATAQQLFEHFMRQEVAPGLRELGFSGSFRQFRYHNDDCVGVVLFQKSRWSDKGRVDFRFHLSAAFITGIQLFHLMPESDRPSGAWWQIRIGEPTTILADRVLHAVRRYGLPAILAGCDASQNPPAGGWPRIFRPIPRGGEDEPDGCGARPDEPFTHPLNAEPTLGSRS